MKLATEHTFSDTLRLATLDTGILDQDFFPLEGQTRDLSWVVYRTTLDDTPDSIPDNVWLVLRHLTPAIQSAIRENLLDAYSEDWQPLSLSSVSDLGKIHWAAAELVDLQVVFFSCIERFVVRLSYNDEVVGTFYYVAY